MIFLTACSKVRFLDGLENDAASTGSWRIAWSILFIIPPSHISQAVQAIGFP
jgi:hypothetical protein